MYLAEYTTRAQLKKAGIHDTPKAAFIAAVRSAIKSRGKPLERGGHSIEVWDMQTNKSVIRRQITWKRAICLQFGCPKSAMAKLSGDDY